MLTPFQTILSPAQNAAIFDPPADPATIERLYTLNPDDLAQLARRWREPNRDGYAVQVCYLRHPRRALLPSETVHATMLSRLTHQIGCRTDDSADYSVRATTLHEHRVKIGAYLDLRTFVRIDVRLMLAL